jgi:Flp pilus assembly protein TadG
MVRSNPASRRRGSALVESALVSIAFLAVLIGIFDLAQFLIVRHSFVERVRAAARYGAVKPNDQTGIRNIVLYGRTTTPDGASSGIFGLSPAMVVVDRTGVGTTGEQISVSVVNYPYRLYSPWLGGVLAAAPVTASLPIEAP